VGVIVIFSIDLTYLFLNFRIRVGQRVFQIKGLKCFGRNPFLPILCQIVGIPVDQSSD